MDKVFASAAEAVADIASGSSLCVGGFGLCGVPYTLIDAVAALDAGDLRIVSNNCGADGVGLGVLLAEHRIARVTASYVGENEEFARQYLAGELEVELTPQGQPRRAAAGGRRWHPRLLHASPASARSSPRAGCPGATAPTAPSPWPRRRRRCAQFDGREYVLERVDHHRLRAGPRRGRRPARQPRLPRVGPELQPARARWPAGSTIAEVEELVEPGELDPDAVHLPGIFVQRVVAGHRRAAARS